MVGFFPQIDLNPFLLKTQLYYRFIVFPLTCVTQTCLRARTNTKKNGLIV